jgi:hypothetical protein
MSKTYADALRYFRTKLKAGPEPPEAEKSSGLVTGIDPIGDDGPPYPNPTACNKQSSGDPAPANVPKSDLADEGPIRVGTRAGTQDEASAGNSASTEAPSQSLPPATAMELPTVEREFITLPDGTKRRISPQKPTEEVYQWSHLMDYSAFRMKTPWRQQQLMLQWIENEAQGGKHINLRGRPNPTGVCFGSCPVGNCTCHDIDGYTKGTL